MSLYLTPDFYLTNLKYISVLLTFNLSACSCVRTSFLFKDTYISGLEPFTK